MAWEPLYEVKDNESKCTVMRKLRGPGGARGGKGRLAAQIIVSTAVRCGREGRHKQAAAPAAGNFFAAGRMDGAVTPRVKSERQERVPSAPVYGIQSVPCASKPAGVQNRRPRRSIHMF